MDNKVLPLLTILLSVCDCLHDGRTARLLPVNTRSFLSPGLDYFPLSGFSHTDSNQVDTLHSVAALDSLPPIRSATSHPAPPPPPTSHSPTPLQGTSHTNTQTVYSRSNPFPTLFDPFKNFFNIENLPTVKQQSTQGVSTEAPKQRKHITTPHTTPTPVVTHQPPTTNKYYQESVYDYYQGEDYVAYDDNDVDDDYDNVKNHNSINAVSEDYNLDDTEESPSCPGSLRECLTACSPVININQVAYKLCVNECLERCS